MRLGMEHVADSFAYADYHRRLDAQAVLDHYGASNQRTEINKDGTTEIIHSCLLDTVERHHANGDQNPSAACNLDKKLYACYVWWSGDMFHFIQKMEGKEGIDGIIPIVGEFLDEVETGTDDFRAEMESAWATIMGGAYSVSLPSYHERILQPWAYVHPYLAERGIDPGTASRLHIGWNERTNRITIPHFWEGHLVGWQERAIPDRPGQWPGSTPAQPKYKSNSGFPKSDTLYHDHGDNQLNGDVIVVESPFSVIKAASLGIHGVVATFGAKVSAAQIALLRECDHVTVWFDDDAAGRIGERKIVTGLVDHLPFRLKVVTPDRGRDLGDCCTPDEVHHKLATAESALHALKRYENEQRRA